MNFNKWIEKQLSKSIPNSVIAINFNLYEADDDNEFDAQIVGCASYDENDSDWACGAIFSSEEDLFHFESDDWEKALLDFENIVRQYLKTHQKTPLNNYDHITFGFVDGDLTVIK